MPSVSHYLLRKTTKQTNKTKQKNKTKQNKTNKQTNKQTDRPRSNRPIAFDLKNLFKMNFQNKTAMTKRTSFT